MIVGTTSGTAQRSSGDLPALQGRALVALSPAIDREPAASFRQAFFLAQLIANRDQLPQTRERRRAAPDEAIAAYRATEALVEH